jgi:hypothetical protein
MNVDLTLPENQNPKTEQEAAEDISTFWLPVDTALEQIEKMAAEEDMDLDGRMHTFLVGMSHKF